tara:strand:+ start:1306 stop:2388 length:1083 start_codon:yes stop_codon:yes gene_type:complete
MIKTLFPTKDATLYEITASANTGLDQILEIRKDISSSAGPLFVSRPVLQFDTTTLSSSLAAEGINTGSDSGSLKYFLKMYVSQEVDVPIEYKLVVHPLREAWDMGTGRFNSDPKVTNGCSWSNKTTGAAWTDAGGYFFSGSHASESVVQTFNNVAGDINIDVTDIIESYHNNTKTNFGFIVKRSGSQETDDNEFGYLAYFSKETNTIYSPRLEARYEDVSSIFNSTTGSVATINDNITISPKLQQEYKYGDISRIFVDINKQYTARSQAGSVGTIYRCFLPSSSSFAIKDLATDEYVYEHDEKYTKVGRTGNTLNYFDLDTKGLFPGRHYCVEFKVNYYSGTKVISTKHYKPDLYFKVVK